MGKFSSRSLSRDPFTGMESKAILNEIRADFDLRPPMPMTVGRIQRDMLALTNEQYDVLDYFTLNDNPRILVNGSAGSGKSQCAVYIAQDLATEGRSETVQEEGENMVRKSRFISESTFELPWN